MQSKGPLEHHNYTELDIECCCSICTLWRERRVEYESIRKFVYHHPRSCFCWKCCRFRELQIEYLAAQNKRDVYCELSWHMSKHSYGPRLMRWLEKELLSDNQTDGWWAKTAPCFSLGHWVYQFSEALAAMAVSGQAA